MKYSLQNLPKPIVLESERMRFEPIRLKHLDDVAIFLSDDEVRTNMKMPTLDTPEKLATWFDRFEEGRNAGTVLQWAAYFKDSERYACLLTLKEIDWANQRGELGYSVNPEFWAKGVGTEAAALGVDYAFNHLDLHTLIAQILPDNEASQSIVRRLGFRQEAHFRDAVSYEGDYFDLLQFSSINPNHRRS
jgi:ribosomal-protein-alanine N-acetyltransferase